MQKDFENLLSSLENHEPSKGLLSKIMRRIRLEQRLIILKRRIVIFSLFLAGSIIALFPAFSMLKNSITESGFMKFASLIFSDLNTAITYWQNLTFALIESLPIINIVLFLTVVFILFESLKFLAKDLKFFFHKSLTTNY